MEDDEIQEFNVRRSGVTEPRHVKRIWLRLAGGKYEGPRNLNIGFARIDGVDFAGVNFEHFSADGAKLRRCDFSGAAINGDFGVNRQTTFDRCRFGGTRLSNVEPGQARFVQCWFDDADLSGWNAAANEFVDCRFTGVVKQCNFWGAPVDDWLKPGALRPGRSRNEFSRNDFRDAELLGVSFLGAIDIGDQMWPESDDYIRLDRFPERVRNARMLVDGWEVDAAKDLAIIVLDVFSKGGFEDQQEIFAHRWSVDAVPRDVMAMVWAALEAPPPRTEPVQVEWNQASSRDIGER